MEALHCANETYENHAVVKRGCDFILDKQKEDGGWGETIEVGHLTIYPSKSCQAKQCTVHYEEDLYPGRIFPRGADGLVLYGTNLRRLSRS